MNRSLAFSFALLAFCSAATAAPPDSAQVRRSLLLATKFMSETVADHGGYAWTSSADGRYSHGEGIAGADRVWVQPPGTPAVGMAFLNAYAATGDELHLKAARGVGDALIQGQLRSGGWGYSIDFDPKIRSNIPYRVGPDGGRDKITPTPKPGGWDVWRTKDHQSNKTLIDDDTTPAAIRFLVRLDAALDFKDDDVHDAAAYALRSTLGAQYPVGAWGHNYDRFAVESPSVSHYPIVSASYPEQWTRASENDFQGCYMINDRVTMNMIETMLVAAKAYNDQRYLKSAIRGGEFLLRAQMPEPQRAWAQQYDRKMQPVWDRKFEPPAISGGESQDVLRTLMVLYRETKDERFLQPIPIAISYLKTCLRSDGKLARYYELQTNRPIYFTKDYQLTYNDREMPDHYGFVVDSHLDDIEREYQQLIAGESPTTTDQSQWQDRAAKVLSSQRADGAWLERGFVRDQNGRKVTPPEGVVQSQTFIDNVEILCRCLGS